ncbi:MAG: beta-galactosidase, partial [Armatimonadetes bacterium]|nr:beta-galactosidase [Armatimonadota bacterium]
MKHCSWIGLCILFAIPAFARVGVVNLGPSYYEVSTEVETPHIKWAKPLAGGRLRVLVIAPRRTQRETVELWQRLEMEYVAIGTEETGVLGATPDSNGPVGGTLPEVEARLREAMKKDYDVIITSGVRWKTLPSEVFNALVGKVKAGAGLILVQPEEKPEGAAKDFFDSFQETPRPQWLLAGSRLEDLPQYRKGEKDPTGPPEKVFSCYRAGDARVVRVRTGGSYWTYLVPDVGDTPGATYLDFEDQMALTSKLLLWASGRVPAASIQAVTFTPDAKTAHVEATGGPNAAGKASCRITIRDRWGNVLGTPTRADDLVSGASAFDVPLPPLKGGQHRAEVQLLTEQGEVIWWGVWPLKVVPPFGIAKVTMASDEVQPGTQAKGVVELTGKPVPGAKLVFRATDSYGRVVCSTDSPAKSGAFSVLVAHPLSVYHQLSVTLAAGDRVLDEARTRFATPIEGPGWDDFSLLFWHHSTEGWIGRLVNRELSRKYLADSLNCAAWQTPQRMEDILWCVAEDGLWATPYSTHFGNYWGNGLLRGPCLSHPDLIKEKTTLMREVGRRLKKFRPPAYNLGDENTLDGKDTDVCFSNECQASFREYLKVMYKGLNTLNAEWGTMFKDWSEVSPITKKEALERGQVPRWVDHRMHMNSVFANIHRLCRDATRESDPQARVGFEGPVGQAGYNGYDLWKFSKFMDFWGPYPYAVDW